MLKQERVWPSNVQWGGKKYSECALKDYFQPQPKVNTPPEWFPVHSPPARPLPPHHLLYPDPMGPSKHVKEDWKRAFAFSPLNFLFESLWSGLCCHHTIETALVKVLKNLRFLSSSYSTYLSHQQYWHSFTTSVKHFSSLGFQHARFSWFFLQPQWFLLLGLLFWLLFLWETLNNGVLQGLVFGLLCLLTLISP